MSSQELITFQVGNYSNYVGTHYWNSQHKRCLNPSEEHNYQTTKLFREVPSNRDCHYVPRLICFDYKHSLKALKEDGTFTADNQDEVSLPEQSDHELYAQDRIPRNKLTKEDIKTMDNENVESKISSWSDYLAQPLHENTIQLLTQGYNDGEEFNYSGVGQDEYKKLFDDVEDKLHFWVEECNSMEGFQEKGTSQDVDVKNQILCDLHDGYAGISSNLIADLHDEYDRKCILPYINWPVFKEDVKHDVYHDLNLALTFQAFKEHASLFVLQSLQTDVFDSTSGVMNLPHVQFEADHPYHTSAILATAFDATTLPWRQSNRSVSMSSSCYQLSQNRFKLAGVNLGFAHIRPDGENSTLFELLLNNKSFYGSTLHSLFPKSLLYDNFYPSTQSIVLQNVREQLVLPQQISSSTLQGLGLNRNVFTRNPQNVLEFFTEKYYPCEKTISKVYYSDEKLNTSLPFPKIFHEDDDDDDDDSRLTMMSSLYTSQNFYDLLHELTTRISNINLHRHHAVTELGVDNDSMNELVEDLTNFCRDYDHQRTFDELDV